MMEELNNPSIKLKCYSLDKGAHLCDSKAFLGCLHGFCCVLKTLDATPVFPISTALGRVLYNQGGQGFGHRGFGQGFGHARNARHETRFWAPEMPKTINLKSIMQNLLKMYNFL